MKSNKEKGFIGIDMVLAILAIMIFSALIASLMYTNTLENLKVRRETLATIYLTEILENIGITTYDEVIQENVNNFIPANLEEDKYNVEITISDDIDLINNEEENIIKKVVATISYELGNKNYQHSIGRIKIKE